MKIPVFRLRQKRVYSKANYRPYNQAQFDEFVARNVIDGVQTLRYVETDSFNSLMGKVAPGIISSNKNINLFTYSMLIAMFTFLGLNVLCRKTLTNRINPYRYRINCLVVQTQGIKYFVCDKLKSTNTRISIRTLSISLQRH